MSPGVEILRPAGVHRDRAELPDASSFHHGAGVCEEEVGSELHPQTPALAVTGLSAHVGASVCPLHLSGPPRPRLPSRTVVQAFAARTLTEVMATVPGPVLPVAVGSFTVPPHVATREGRGWLLWSLDSVSLRNQMLTNGHYREQPVGPELCSFGFIMFDDSELLSVL